MATNKSYFTNMFGSSPIKPLQTHMDKVVMCAKELPRFFDNIIAKDYSKAEKTQLKISKLENEADYLKRTLRMHLPKTLFMAVPREDLLEILTIQDEIANQAKDIAGIMIGRKMVIPDKMAELFQSFVSQCVNAAVEADIAINELDELLVAGFRGRITKSVETMIRKLDKTEHDTDKMERQLRRKLFAIEDKLPPVHVMFLYRIIESTGELADLAQRVGNRLELLMAKD